MQVSQLYGDCYMTSLPQGACHATRPSIPSRVHVLKERGKVPDKAGDGIPDKAGDSSLRSHRPSVLRENDKIINGDYLTGQSQPRAAMGMNMSSTAVMPASRPLPWRSSTTCRLGNKPSTFQ